MCKSMFLCSYCGENFEISRNQKILSKGNNPYFCNPPKVSAELDSGA